MNFSSEPVAATCQQRRPQSVLKNMKYPINMFKKNNDNNNSEILDNLFHPRWVKGSRKKEKYLVIQIVKPSKNQKPYTCYVHWNQNSFLN